MAAPRLNGPFKYRQSVDTDIRRTFRRVRAEQKAREAAAAPAPAPAEPAAIPVTPLRRVAR